MVGVVQYEGSEHEYAAVVGFDRREAPIPAGQGSSAVGSRVGNIDQNVLDAVVEHRLPPGAKLTEDQLGAIFGASRTTVRSALQALAHDHIVTLAVIAEALGEGFHITSDHAYTWNDIYDTIAEGLGAKADIVHVPTETLVRYHPEWEGPLMGDKTWPALFDNAKVKRAAGDFASVK
jgi:Bacterial regulatory proteins, gntR family